jgi:nucleotide-binding universal stress UspA family protein
MADDLLDHDADVTPRHILVAVDGSPASLNAVRYAAGIARTTGARLDLLAVVDVSSTIYYGGAVQQLELVERGYANAVREAAELVPPDVPVMTFVDRGHAAARIAHHAEVFGCDLIVMGSRGRGRTTAALFGSTSQGVLHATCVPVLVLRTPAAAPVAAPA